MAIHIDLAWRGDRAFARVDGGEEFLVGRRVRWAQPGSGPSRIGLINTEGAGALAYSAAAFEGAFGVWARVLEPTAWCEGRSFLTLNTYDRAGFTFGFAQFAAHVPDGDFVRWLRAMLARPEAGEWLPELEVAEGRVRRRGRAEPMETSASTAGLRTWLNPGPAVEAAELETAARLIGWTRAEPETRALQVRFAAEAAKRILREADTRLGLDGREAAVCCAVFDIRHQGRGTYGQMRTALAEREPLEALLRIGAGAYRSRVATLRARIAAAELEGWRWSRAAGELVRG